MRLRTRTRRPHRVLVLVAHPCADSFTHASADAALRGLRAGGHEVKVIDLYAARFQVAMTLEERQAYMSEQPLLDPQTVEHAELVRWADRLVFVYPTWWAGMPAILKGWLERVLVTGVAFDFDDRGKVRPGLTHLRRVVGISTYGSHWAYVKAINDNGRRTVSRALRLSCGPRTRCTWLALYGVDGASAERRQRFLARVEQTMRTLR